MTVKEIYNPFHKQGISLTPERMRQPLVGEAFGRVFNDLKPLAQIGRPIRRNLLIIVAVMNRYWRRYPLQMIYW